MNVIVDQDKNRQVYDRGMYMFSMPEQYAEPDLERRFEYLDRHGIDIQVLSTPRSSDYSAEEGAELAKRPHDGMGIWINAFAQV